MQETVKEREREKPTKEKKEQCFLLSRYKMAAGPVDSPAYTSPPPRLAFSRRIKGEKRERQDRDGIEFRDGHSGES